ncbi:MAG: molybdopterin molybdotransferase MoeA [Magnetospirillum sp.]|nr:molybdopterin molybdotransferase MoeA [Magnetospirillum sp.]
MIAVETALERVLAGLRPLAGESVALPQALGRVLAADLAARVSHPPLAVSSMDGWAVRAADVAAVPARLAVAGTSAAGHPFAGTVRTGQAVRIFTGAPLPDGADAVARQEDCRAEGGAVTVTVGIPPGKFVRPAGLDFAVGDVLLTAGTVMDPRRIGLAAAMNIPWLPVRRRPRVAVLSTGDEIRMPGEPLAPAQIPGSNGPALAALIEASGGLPMIVGIASDTAESLAGLIAAAEGADLLVISGGASVGDYDMVAPALAEAGMALDFWKVAMRPGKPLMCGRLRGTPVLGLPGNPVAALVCATLFLVPMLRTLAGLALYDGDTTAILGRDLPANDDRQDYLRSSLERRPDGTLVATPFAKQDSAVLSGLAAADALVVRPPHAPAAKAGESVTVLPLAGI